MKAPKALNPLTPPADTTKPIAMAMNTSSTAMMPTIRPATTVRTIRQMVRSRSSTLIRNAESDNSALMSLPVIGAALLPRPYIG
jgi:hypothetical protein